MTWVIAETEDSIAETEEGLNERTVFDDAETEDYATVSVYVRPEHLADDAEAIRALMLMRSEMRGYDQRKAAGQ